MSSTTFYPVRNDRSLRYAGRVLDPSHWVLLRLDEHEASRYDRQVALFTAANLFPRMTPAVALDVPDVDVHSALPWVGQRLRGALLDMMSSADPYGHFCVRSEENKGDYTINLGPVGKEHVVHGSGWNVYMGPPPSPLVPQEEPNPIGPAMSSIFAAAEAFRENLGGKRQKLLMNTLNWDLSTVYRPVPVAQPELGEIWTIGTGSVGTASLFFLAMASRNFSTLLIDHDFVGVENLDRSPLFSLDDVGHQKVEATGDWLRAAGVCHVEEDACPLDESLNWRNRVAGRPDLILAAANERNVRALIEMGLPPVQIYGTTGRNWQAAVVRHVPTIDACSCCLFPPDGHAPTQCSTGTMDKPGSKPVDAALPFLSFAAGAMAASEILKLCLPGFPFTSNRLVVNTQVATSAQQARIPHVPGCICSEFSGSTRRKMLAGSRYAHLCSY